MRISRPCYDKPHRCPGWAGGGWKFAKTQTCASGQIVLWKIGDSTRNWFSPYDWRIGHCSTCGIYTIPFALRRLDPRWWWGYHAWRIKYWITDLKS